MLLKCQYLLPESTHCGRLNSHEDNEVFFLSDDPILVEQELDRIRANAIGHCRVLDHDKFQLEIRKQQGKSSKKNQLKLYFYRFRYSYSKKKFTRIQIEKPIEDNVKVTAASLKNPFIDDEAEVEDDIKGTDEESSSEEEEEEENNNDDLEDFIVHTQTQRFAVLVDGQKSTDSPISSSISVHSDHENITPNKEDLSPLSQGHMLAIYRRSIQSPNSQSIFDTSPKRPVPNRYRMIKDFSKPNEQEKPLSSIKNDKSEISEENIEEEDNWLWEEDYLFKTESKLPISEHNPEDSSLTSKEHVIDNEKPRNASFSEKSSTDSRSQLQEFRNGKLPLKRRIDFGEMPNSSKETSFEIKGIDSEKKGFDGVSSTKDNDEDTNFYQEWSLCDSSRSRSRYDDSPGQFNLCSPGSAPNRETIPYRTYDPFSYR